MSLKTLFIVCCCLLAVVNFLYYKRTEHPFRNGFLSILSGVVLLIPICLILQQFGIDIQVNYTTLVLSGLLGIPGIALMIIFLQI